MDRSFLKKLEAGDEVIETHRFAGPEVRTVTRTTLTQIIIGTRRYRKTNGMLIGATTFSWGSLREATRKNVEEITKSQKRRESIHNIKSFDWNGASDETIAAVVKLLEGTDDEHS